IGTPSISGSNQWPCRTMSRAISGNRVSSLVVKTRVPKSKNRSTALTASSTATRQSDERRSEPALIGQIVVAPGVEHEEAPQHLAMVALATHVLGDESCHRRRLEEAATCNPRRGQTVLEDRAERPA